MAPTRPPRPTRAAWLAAAGLMLTIAGVVGYFVLVVRFGAWLPGVRNTALPSWIAMALGVALALLAVLRATPGRRLLATIAAGVNVLVAGAFAWFLTVGLAVPPASGPAVGRPAPAFALLDQSGKTWRLDDFRGAPLLLVFYRGHW